MARSRGQVSWGAVFQEAALEPERWLRALRVLAETTGSARAQLIGIGSADAVAFNWVNDFSEEALADYARSELNTPQQNYRINANLHAVPGTILYEADYRAASLRLASDAYLDFCQDNDIPWGCQTNLIQEGEALVGLALLRRESDRPTNAAQRAEFGRAAEAARMAVRLQRAVEQQGHALLTGALEAMSAPCMLLDGNGRVSATTPSAEAVLGAAPELRLVEGQLLIDDPVLGRTLALALRAVLLDRRAERLMLHHGRRLDLFPLARREWALGFAPAAVAVFRDPDADLRAAAARVTDQFELSPAEASVVALIAQGRSRREIAVARGVSDETLKSQFRAIYAKTGCTRESEIMALLARLR